MLLDSLLVSGLVSGEGSDEVVELLFGMAHESFGREHDAKAEDRIIANPQPLSVIVALLPTMPLSSRERFLRRFLALAKVPLNAQLLSNAGIVASLLSAFEALDESEQPAL